MLILPIFSSGLIIGPNVIVLTDSLLAIYFIALNVLPGSKLPFVC